MAIVLIVLGYLLGSFPSGVVIGRMRGQDVRREGSGNIGAANAARVLGRGAGATVAALDVAKGMLAVIIARWVGAGDATLALVALAAVLGHDFSLFLRFRGGKGVATSFGAAIALAPVAGVADAALWVAILLVTAISSIASLIALAVLPLIMALTGRPTVDVELAFVLFVVAALKHYENIGRLLRGTEPGFRD